VHDDVSAWIIMTFPLLDTQRHSLIIDIIITRRTEVCTETNHHWTKFTPLVYYNYLQNLVQIDY